MRLINLQAENIKKLIAIDITPTQDLIQITGKNGAGKSSVLDCITMLLGGTGEIPPEPLKKGTKKGKIKGILGKTYGEKGEYIITRSFVGENTYLKVESKDGEIKSPQKFLDTMLGKISFDPLAFINENNPKQQRDILLKLVGIDTTKIDKEEKELREKRTIIGRDLTNAKAKVESAEYYQEVVSYTEEINVKELANSYHQAVDYNTKLQKRISDNEAIKEKGLGIAKEIESIRQQIAGLESKKDDLQVILDSYKNSYRTNKDELEKEKPQDTSVNKLQESNELNRKIRANIQHGIAVKEADKLDISYLDCTLQIDTITEKRNFLITDTKMPVSGLSFNENGLLYNGIPLEQASTSEKLRISLGISMALNPTLHVLRSKEGSLLDSDNLAVIKEMVEDKEYQLWLETVDDTGKVGIFIEEGKVKANNISEVKKVKTKGDETW